MTETIKITVCDDAYLSDGKEHDIAFLDIEMGGSDAGLDGMGLERHIRDMEAQKQPVIIL